MDICAVICRARPLIVVAVGLLVAAAVAQEPAGEAEPNEQSTEAQATGVLPLPRFVSLRTDPVNLRTGPGVRYPVEWVYVRRGLPVEVIAEFETWRRIRDIDGAEGWVHQSMLSARRTAIVRPAGGPKDPRTMGMIPLRKTNTDPSDSVASLEAGVVVTVQRCPAGNDDCRIEVAGHQGWLKRALLWGIKTDESID